MAVVFEKNDTFPYDYLTNQETQIANKLKALNNQAPVGRLLISDTKLAVHIMALTGFLSFYDPYFLSYAVDGTVNASVIQNNSNLRPINQWYNNYIFNFNASVLGFSPYNIMDQLFLNNMSTSLPFLAKFNTSYVITLHSALVTTDWISFNSPFINDLFFGQNSKLIFSTKDLYLWKLIY